MTATAEGLALCLPPSLLVTSMDASRCVLSRLGERGIFDAVELLNGASDCDVRVDLLLGTTTRSLTTWSIKRP